MKRKHETEGASSSHIGTQPVGQMLDLFDQPAFIFRSDTLILLDANSAASDWYGYDRTEFRRLTALDVRPRADHERFLTQVVPHLKPERQEWVNSRHLTKEGTVLFVDVTTDRLDWGAEPTFVAAVRPRTRSVPDEESRTRFDLLMHDLRTPLTSILGFAITLTRHDVLESPELCEKLAGRLAQNARILTRILDEEVVVLTDLVSGEAGDARDDQRHLMQVRSEVSQFAEAAFTAGKHLLNALRWAGINPASIETQVEALERVWPTEWTYDTWCAWNACRSALRAASKLEDPWEVAIMSHDRRRMWRTSAQHVDVEPKQRLRPGDEE